MTPELFIKKNDKLNHIDFMTLIIEELIAVGVNVSFIYPEECSNVTLEITERSPAIMSSKTIGHAGVVNRPIAWKDEYNIVDGTIDTYNINFYDNVIRLTVYDRNVLDAEKTAILIETLISKKYHHFRKHVDNLKYNGRLTSGFSSAYNDRKLYSIPMMYSFRTSEIFYESNPPIREVVVDLENNTI